MEKRMNITYEFFENISELSEKDQELFSSAVTSSKRAQAPYSKFNVGASALLSDGRIISGFNIENAAYPQCMCAEQVLLSNVKTQLELKQSIVKIAIYSPNLAGNDILSPCGSCRQILREQEHRQETDIKLILSNSNGEVWIFNSIAQLLPFSFNSNNFDV